VGQHEAFRMLQKTAMDRRVRRPALADPLVMEETSFSARRKRAPRES
jgi:AmiR/NasT family two-component response regulator